MRKFKKELIIIPLIIMIPVSIYLLLIKGNDGNLNAINYTIANNNINHLNATIIDKDNNYLEIITENDSIYKVEYESKDLDIGDSIIISYNKKINYLNELQDIDIENIEKSNIKSKYSNKAIDILNNLTLKEKIGQLLLVRVPETNKLDVINDYNIGGYILFKRDINNKTKQELISDIKSFQSTSKTPLLIAIDEEGGTVTRLSSNKNIVKTPFLSPQQLYKNGGFEKIKEDSINKVNLLEELGINVNLAPVADIATKKSSYMYDRSFGKDKYETSKYIETVLSTQTKSVTYVLKHFPGYGDNIDTHKNVSIDDRSFELISENDFLPFKTGIENDAKAILISHNIASDIDNKPATLSRIMHNILRDYLKFNGVIITDDLDMNAIKGYKTNEPYMEAVLAGNNLLIVSDYKDAFNEIYNGVINGKISETLIDKLVIKNIQFKIDKDLYNI